MRRTTQVLTGLVRPDRRTAVVDVGANPIDGAPPYAQMLDDGLCTVTGFEPQADALAALRARASALETYLPYVVGDGGTHVLHIAAASGMTSLLEPDPARLRDFNGFSGWGAVVATEEVETRRMDDLAEISAMDFLKIDVQGGELMVFGGAPRLLRDAVAVQTEVSFVPLYKGQPSIGQVDLALRDHGFIPHAMPALKRWAIAPVIFGGEFRLGRHQLLEADLVYVRDFGRTDDMSDAQLQHLALLAECVFDSPDLAHRCLATLVARGAAPGDGPARYLAAV